MNCYPSELVGNVARNYFLDLYNSLRRSATVTMSTVSPSSTTWTLRLKYHKTTVLLHADPLQSVQRLKHDLLNSLRAIKPSSTFLNGRSLPSSASQIQLAKPCDASDPTSGWELIEESDDATLQANGPDGKGKGKAKAKPASSEFTLRGVGVRDNFALAFRWQDRDEGFEDEEWDVIIPTFEDMYGVENVGDVGEFRDVDG